MAQRGSVRDDRGARKERRPRAAPTSLCRAWTLTGRSDRRGASSERAFARGRGRSLDRHPLRGRGGRPGLLGSGPTRSVIRCRASRPWLDVRHELGVEPVAIDELCSPLRVDLPQVASTLFESERVRRLPDFCVAPVETQDFPPCGDEDLSLVAYRRRAAERAVAGIDFRQIVAVADEDRCPRASRDEAAGADGEDARDVRIDGRLVRDDGTADDRSGCDRRSRRGVRPGSARRECGACALPCLRGPTSRGHRAGRRCCRRRRRCRSCRGGRPFADLART